MSVTHSNVLGEYFVKFERVVFEIRERTDRETDIQTCSSLYFTLLLGGGGGKVLNTFSYSHSFKNVDVIEGYKAIHVCWLSSEFDADVTYLLTSLRDAKSHSDIT